MHTQSASDDAFSHEIDYIGQVWGILNFKESQNHIIGSEVIAILLNGLILPIDRVTLGILCAFSWLFSPPPKLRHLRPTC